MRTSGRRAEAEFTVGICSTGESSTPRLVSEVLAEERPEGIRLAKVVVVVSGAQGEVVSSLRRIREDDPRVVIIEEGSRRGKAEAVNRIIENSAGEFLVLSNSDSSPDPGAISKIVRLASSDPATGSVSATPQVERRQGPAALLLDLMWTTHNNASLALNHMGIANHATDELIALRREGIEKLPDGLVNDGAFLAGTLKNKGYLVKVCPDARVRVSTPGKVSEIISQRRRIIFGHTQVWKTVGHPPKTIESLMLLSAPTGFTLLAKSVAENPRFLLILPLAAVVELSASFLAIFDTLAGTRRHSIWRRSR